MVARTKPRQRRGATAVEFAIVAQVVFILVFASIEFSRLNMIRNLAQDAAYFAARNSMVPGATAEEATAVANEILAYMNTQGASVVINGGDGISQTSPTVSVDITVPIAENALFVSGMCGDGQITTSATMRTERYDGYYNPNE